MIYPEPLKKGDAVAIVSPASKIDGRLVDEACAVIERWGFRPVVSEFCKGAKGSFSGTLSQRVHDFRQAYADKRIRAVLCSRGGYGTVQLFDSLPSGMWTDDPKWLIGFSDISALHAASFRAGVASVHASMCKHLSERPDDECSLSLFRILCGEMPDYRVSGDGRNREGTACGRIVGGNMAVLMGLAATPYNLFREGHILFIEDISEAIYKVERMLYTLRLNGTLANTKALIVGQFTDYKPTYDWDSMYAMIGQMVEGYDFPVAYNFPVGHTETNLPIVEGALAELSVGRSAVRLRLKME